MAEFKKLINEIMEEKLPVNFVWAIAGDITNDTMTATGVEDELPYEDVQLGLEDMIIEPVKGTECILAVLDSGAFLMRANKINKIIINGGANGGLVISGKVAEEMNKIIVRTNSIVTSLTNLATALSAAGTTPLTGAVLSGLITTAIAGIITPLTQPQKTVFENSKIMHG